MRSQMVGNGFPVRHLIATAAAAFALITPAHAETGGSDMPATHAEWDRVQEGLTVPQVRGIIGSQGDEGGHDDDGRYRIDFALAWRDDKVGRVVFSEASNLSIDKNIVIP